MWQMTIDGPEAVNVVRAALKNLFPNDPIWSLLDDEEWFSEDAMSKVRYITVCDDGTATIGTRNPNSV